MCLFQLSKAPRSGLAWKHSIDVGAGVIDADYRGPVGVILFNYSDVDFEVKAGDRIAQLIIAIFPHFSCASLFVKTPYFVLKYQGRISRKYTVLPEIYFSIAFKDPQAGVKPPGVWKTFLGVISQVRTTNNLQRCACAMEDAEGDLEGGDGESEGEGSDSEED
ncbi:hypothetical protein POM88_050694 [Heracleum sosnowskyi]|uniref:Deoxyuridine 5'-triphosphate nucleotidohydrolase n=1 Tax=Heracleum sosnowskyi TaxID=360622 RepID=A0AAD8M300_9APIA|nr:hypothetical protein POM88_050694 [Heracleum sosnowskyi]